MRACLPKARSQLRAVCTEFTSGIAQGEWCACEGHMCNAAGDTLAFTLLIMTATFVSIVVALTFE